MRKAIVNLTLHQLTEEQCAELRKECDILYPISKGVVFDTNPSLAKSSRQEWASCWALNIAHSTLEGCECGPHLIRRHKGDRPEICENCGTVIDREAVEVNAVIGGDTAANMLLMEASVRESLWNEEGISKKQPDFLAAITERTRDEHDRFTFAHKGWMRF